MVAMAARRNDWSAKCLMLVSNIRCTTRSSCSTSMRAAHRVMSWVAISGEGMGVVTSLNGYYLVKSDPVEPADGRGTDALFPLTLTLSPGEREQQTAVPCTFGRRAATAACGSSSAKCHRKRRYFRIL